MKGLLVSGFVRGAPRSSIESITSWAMEEKLWAQAPGSFRLCW